MCFLPETCPCRCHDCTPQPPCGFWTECMRCCADLYSSQAEREQTNCYRTDKISHKVPNNNKRKFRVQKAQLFTIFTHLFRVRVTEQCVRVSPETILLKKNVFVFVYRKIIKTKLLRSNSFRCYICFTLYILCIIPQKKIKNCARNFQQRNTKREVTLLWQWP